MTDFSPTISDAGFDDVLAGAELYKILRVGPAELAFPDAKDRLVGIADFVNKYPDSLQRISQAMRRMPRGSTPLEHVGRFVVLQEKRMGLKSQIAQLEKEISMYE